MSLTNCTLALNSGHLGTGGAGGTGGWGPHGSGQAGAIGANALLAKVCAYYHDLGKIRNTLSFAENQRAENRHDGLAPSMSALIIKRHVTDGLELARYWALPRAVAAAIPEHHGTRLVSFFWARRSSGRARMGRRVERSTRRSSGIPARSRCRARPPWS
jgi:putative nucleotidyltransferase with HDIG domain